MPQPPQDARPRVQPCLAKSDLSLKSSSAIGAVEVLRYSENAGWAHGAVCVCVFARKGIVTAKLLAFNEPKARTKKGRFPCLGMHLLTCVYIQLSLRTGGLVPWFAEFAVQPVARTYLLVQEETRRCVTPCFVQVTLEGRTRTPCLAAGFMEGEATVRLCHQLNPPRIP